MDRLGGEANYISGVLVHIVDKLLGLGRREVQVPGGAVPAGDSNREPASARAESGLAFGKRADCIASSEFAMAENRDSSLLCHVCWWGDTQRLRSVEPVTILL